MLKQMRKALAAAALVAGVVMARPALAEPVYFADGPPGAPEGAYVVGSGEAAADAAEAVPGPALAPGELAVASLDDMLPVEIIVSPTRRLRPDDQGEAMGPLDFARDYGRLLILLSVPAAFVGLYLHLSRRALIVPPSA